MKRIPVSQIQYATGQPKSSGEQQQQQQHQTTDKRLYQQQVDEILQRMKPYLDREGRVVYRNIRGFKGHSIAEMTGSYIMELLSSLLVSNPDAEEQIKRKSLDTEAFIYLCTIVLKIPASYFAIKLPDSDWISLY